MPDESTPANSVNASAQQEAAARNVGRTVQRFLALTTWTRGYFTATGQTSTSGNASVETTERASCSGSWACCVITVLEDVVRVYSCMCVHVCVCMCVCVCVWVAVCHSPPFRCSQLCCTCSSPVCSAGSGVCAPPHNTGSPVRAKFPAAPVCPCAVAAWESICSRNNAEL